MKNLIPQVEPLTLFLGREKTVVNQENSMKDARQSMTHIKRLINNQKGLGKIIAAMNLLIIGNNTLPRHV